MQVFIFGVIIGIITGGFTILLIAALHVHEVEIENEYLKEQLKEQAKERINSEYGIMSKQEIKELLERWRMSHENDNN